MIAAFRFFYLDLDAGSCREELVDQREVCTEDSKGFDEFIRFCFSPFTSL